MILVSSGFFLFSAKRTFQFVLTLGLHYSIHRFRKRWHKMVLGMTKSENLGLN